MSCVSTELCIVDMISIIAKFGFLFINPGEKNTPVIEWNTATIDTMYLKSFEFWERWHPAWGIFIDERFTVCCLLVRRWVKVKQFVHWEHWDMSVIDRHNIARCVDQWHISLLSHEYIYKSHFNALQRLNHVVHKTDTTLVPVSRQHFTSDKNS